MGEGREKNKTAAEQGRQRYKKGVGNQKWLDFKGKSFPAMGAREFRVGGWHRFWGAVKITLYLQTPEFRTSSEEESDPEGGLDEINT